MLIRTISLNNCSFALQIGSMTKRIIEWIEQDLPSPFKEEALKNVESPNLKYSSLDMALISAFEWMDTPQGFDYWKDVYDGIKNV